MRWTETEETVRFNEVDEWGLAWHGHYVAWFEAGRLDLLRRFDLMPHQMVELGYIAPVIRLECDFKHPAKCGDRISATLWVNNGAIVIDNDCSSDFAGKSSCQYHFDMMIKENSK